MRLAAIDSTNSGFDVEFGYDGQEMVLESLSAGRTRRYVFGQGTDEPLVAYLTTPGVGTSRVWYQADERGSIARQSNDSGTPHSIIGKYDEYGAGGTGRFRYTGQYWLGEANLLYYRARVYDARLGRFLQPDPIGYGAGMNMYAYVGGDPVNFTDPSGLECINTRVRGSVEDLSETSGIVTAGKWIRRCFNDGASAGGRNSGGGRVNPGRRPRSKRPQSTCERALERPGRIETGSVEGAAILGLGLAGSVGWFRNIRTGDSGYFWSAGIGAGADLGGSLNVGIYSSLKEFVGYADNYNFSVPGVGGFAAPSGSVTKDLDGNVVGGTAAASRGPAALRAGASGTFTNTSLFRCSIGPSR